MRRAMRQRDFANAFRRMGRLHEIPLPVLSPLPPFEPPPVPAKGGRMSAHGRPVSIPCAAGSELVVLWRDYLLRGETAQTFLDGIAAWQQREDAVERWRAMRPGEWAQ